MGFLHEHIDTGLELSDKELAQFDPSAWQEIESVRAVTEAQKLAIAASIPRRLGGEASREELAKDKKMARRLEWTMRNAVVDWKGDPDLILAAMPDEIRREGTVLLLDEWVADRVAYVAIRKSKCAALCARLGLIKLGSQFVQRYLNEQKNLKWASR